MPKLIVPFLAAFLTLGCSSYNIGADHENNQPGGSYAGSTLNSPVTDQNPHVGGDSSYPTSTAAGEMPEPPQKTDDR